MFLRSLLLSITGYGKKCSRTHHYFEIYLKKWLSQHWYHATVLPFELNCNWEPNEWFIKNRYGRYIIKPTNQETIPLVLWIQPYFWKLKFLRSNWKQTVTVHIHKYTCILTNRIQYGKQMHRRKKKEGKGVWKSGKFLFCGALSSSFSLKHLYLSFTESHNRWELLRTWLMNY